MQTENATENTTTARRGRPPVDFEGRMAYLSNKGISPIKLAGRPISEVTVSNTLALPEKDFDGRERLDKRARTIAGVTARAINEAASKTNAETKHAREYLVAQVIRLLSDNI